MVFTKEQSAIIDLVPVAGDTVLINACAGSGKTTCLVEFCKRQTDPILYVAFGKSDAQEASERLRPFPNVEVRTFDSIVQEKYNPPVAFTSPYFTSSIAWDISGWGVAQYIYDNFGAVWDRPTWPKRFLRSNKRKRNSEPDKLDMFMIKRDVAVGVIPILQALYSIDWSPTADPCPELDAAMTTAVDMAGDDAKIWYQKCGDFAPYLIQRVHIQLHDQFRLQHPSMVEWARRTVARSVTPIPHKILVVDESQDLNRNMVKWVLAQTHVFKLMAGDNRQHIFQFMHSCNTLYNLKMDNMRTLELTYSFRFGRNIAECINSIFGTNIKGMSEDPGRIFWQVAADQAILKSVNEDTPLTMLCRTNRKLAETILTVHTTFNRQTSPFDTRPLWQTMAQKPVINIMGCESLKKLREEVEKCKKQGSKKYRTVLSETKSSWEQWLCKDYGWARVAALIEFYEQGTLTHDRRAAKITISTIHRFKGKESPLVHTSDDLKNSNEEESNLYYTALTRATQSLLIGNTA